MSHRETHKLRVLLADDHDVIRQGLGALIDSDAGMQCVAAATNGLEAVMLAQLCAPDVVVMDLDMPELDGISATRSIKSAAPAVRVVILTYIDNDPARDAASRAGAAAFLTKDSAPDDVLAAVRQCSPSTDSDSDSDSDTPPPRPRRGGARSGVAVRLPFHGEPRRGWSHPSGRSPC